MSLYPTLEDLKIDEIFTAQECEELRNRSPLYTALKDSGNTITQQTRGSFMNVEMRHYMDEAGNVVFSEPANEIETIKAPQSQITNKIVALDHDSNHTTNRAIAIPEGHSYEPKQGVKKLVLCKDARSIIGFQCRSVDTGVFVSFVRADSPAAKGGLQFGDQILQFNGHYTASKSSSQLKDFVKHAPINNIEVIVRDRPFERNVTLVKDSYGKVGFTAQKGCIQQLVKDSSAARNGILTNYQITKINGINVIGLDDKTIQSLIQASNQRVTITTMHKKLFQVLIKNLGASQMRKEMDRSEPEL